MTSPIAALIDQARALERQGDLAASLRCARQALELAAAEGQTDLQDRARMAQAQVFFRLGDYAEARRLCECVAGQGEDRAVGVDALRLLGIIALETDQMSAGEAYLRRVVALTRRSGDDLMLARTLHNLSAGVYMPRGQFDLSLAHDEEALRILRAHPNAPEAQASTWAVLMTPAWVNWLCGRAARVEQLLQEIQPYILPGSLGDVYVHLLRGGLKLDAGALEEAGPELALALSLSERLGSPEGRVFARLARARQRRLAADAPAALQWALDGLAIAETVGYGHLRGLALIERGRAREALGEPSAAAEDYRAAIALLAPMELDFDRARAELLLAGVTLSAPDWQAALGSITRGGFWFLFDQERALGLRLLAAHLEEPEGASLLQRLVQLPAPPLRVETLGGLRAWVGRRPLERSTLRQRAAGELLCLLLLAPPQPGDGQNRARLLAYEQIIEALCPQKDPAAAQVYLQHAISTLRRALEPDLPDRRFPSRYLEAAEGRLELRLPPGSGLDFEQFEAACAAGDWAAALELWRGDFLPEYRYADWALQKREVLGGLLRRALLEQAEARFSAADWPAALALGADRKSVV